MSLDINCGKCGKKISTTRMLKSIKDIMKHYNNKCPSCGQVLSTSEFSIDVEEK
jgi:DNA-directed RNA polymerase subunit RPC12/RpoP|tara:strand:- start:176 stop:337 length:162 start_codon:yes stop_codon:yes gene_type:complete